MPARISNIHSHPLQSVFSVDSSYRRRLCGCGGAYDAFACCASLNLSLFFFFALSHTLNSSLRLPFRHRADTRRELTELQPFNLTHVLADVPNGKTSTRCSKIREHHSEVGGMDDFDSRTAGQHFGSPHRTMSDATRLTEKRDEEAGREEGKARRRSGMATGRWHTAQGAASVESGTHSLSAEHDHRPPCHVSRLPYSTGADPREVDKSIQMSSYNSDELVGVDIRPSFIRSYRRRVKINSVNLRSFVHVPSQKWRFGEKGPDRVSKQGSQSVHRSTQGSEYMRVTAPLDTRRCQEQRVT